MVCDPAPELLTIEWPSCKCADATQISYLQIQACRECHVLSVAQIFEAFGHFSELHLFGKVFLQQNVSETYFFRKFEPTCHLMLGSKNLPAVRQGSILVIQILSYHNFY